MKEYIISELTSKNDKYACAIADKIISESKETDKLHIPSQRETSSA